MKMNSGSYSTSELSTQQVSIRRDSQSDGQNFGCVEVLTRVDSCCFKSKFYRKDLIDELNIFGMSSRHHIDDFMRGRIIGKIEEGRKITDVAREFDIAHSVVSQLWKSFKTTGMCSRRHGGGRV
ncbi:hypothetical protein TNCV_469851 [Trichonephila clavipes]|nr:hypothetical protein TNCV_469851 [Trichonephila clavipes]